MLSITGVMILPPYLGCTLYLWQIADRPDFPGAAGIDRHFARFCGIAGSAYALWMIYAAGLKYLLLAFTFQLIGIPVYLWTRSRAEPGRSWRKLLTVPEQYAAGLILLVSCVGIVGFATGKINL